MTGTLRVEVRNLLLKIAMQKSQWCLLWVISTKRIRFYFFIAAQTA